MKSYDVASLCSVPAKVETRWATHENPFGEKGKGGKARNGRKGSAWFTLHQGEESVLAQVGEGSGVVRRIWITVDPLDPQVQRGTILRMYWDGATTAAVVAPLGDFFCHGPKHMATFDNALFSSPEGRSFVCMIPMPFAHGMKITVENCSGEDIKHFYYAVDYTVGDDVDESGLYFHAFFNRQNPTQYREDFEILPKISGEGRFLGTNLGIVCDTERYFQAWWGEGEVKGYIDGDEDYPTLCGTGVEDYVSTAWGQDRFYSQYHGSQYYDSENMVVGCYRLHVPDPVYFHKDIRMTIQQIGGFDTNDELNKALFHWHQLQTGFEYPSVNGGMIDIPAINPKIVQPELFERQDDWSSCAYFYVDSPEQQLEPLPVETWLE